MPSDEREALFRKWVAEHSAAVLKVARAYTRTSEDCQDLAQEILLQAWLSLPRYEGRASPATWFYRVALNTALGWHRNERRRRSRQKPLLSVDDVSCPEPGCPEEAADREVVEKLYAAIRQLPKSDAALILLYLDGLTYRQMAEILGITESNVGAKLNRAKKTLCQNISDQPHDL